MAVTGRLCARCQRTLTKKRQTERKKYCGKCAPIVAREQRASAHDRRVAETYGLYAGEYLMIYDVQDGRCAICQRATGARKRLAVDHDHAIADKRKSVRGLLCSTCNRMVGHSRDDTEFFRRAIEYLINPPARKVLGNEQ